MEKEGMALMNRQRGEAVRVVVCARNGYEEA
jgi:hypothetical protein